MESTRIGFIGAGNMANSLIRGLLAKGANSANIWAADVDERKLELLRTTCHIQIATSAEIASTVDVIVLAVKPQVMKAVCVDLAKSLESRKVLLISIAAGITLGHMERWFGANSAIVRCMPNTPALVGKGATGLFANRQVTQAQHKLAGDILASVGLSLWVPNEADIDSVTALSGSGPAYFFLFMEAMQAAGKEMGLHPELARKLTYQTALGAAELALRSSEETADLRRNVTSPGGTTEQAIKQFTDGGLQQLVSKAVHAAQKRSVELAAEFGKE